jgi:plasmid stability protein
MLSIDDSIASRYHSVVASIIIRNLDETVARRLRLQAKLKGVAMEQEARRILTEGTRVTRRDILAVARGIRARQQPHTSRAEDLIREDRER